MVVCITGQPLSGKSYLAELMAHIFDYSRFSTGEYARSLGMKKDEESIKQNDISLELNDQINEAVLEQLEHGNVIIDGWPRSVEQALLLQNHREDFLIIYIFIGLKLMMDRMVKRKRFDDTLEMIEGRSRASLKYYYSLAEYMQEKLVVLSAENIATDTQGVLRCLEDYLVD